MENNVKVELKTEEIIIIVACLKEAGGLIGLREKIQKTFGEDIALACANGLVYHQLLERLEKIVNERLKEEGFEKF